MRQEAEHASNPSVWEDHCYFSCPWHAFTIFHAYTPCSWNHFPWCWGVSCLGGNLRLLDLNKDTAIYLCLESWQDKLLPISLLFLLDVIFFSVLCNCHCLSIRKLILIQSRKLVYINSPGAGKNRWGIVGLKEFKEWHYWDLGFLPKRNLIYSVSAFCSPLISFHMSWHRYRPVPP